MQKKAVLLCQCKDQKGIVSAVTDYIHSRSGNITSLDQHVDYDEDQFFMRVEWTLDTFEVPESEIAPSFNKMLGNPYDMTWSIKFKSDKPVVAIFVSKYGHCLYDILGRYANGEWDIEIPLVISNHEKMRPIVEKFDIPYYVIPINKENKDRQEQKQLQLLKEHNVDTIILARYMQILTDKFVKQYKDQIINIHHSSLPAFAGANPYGSAFKRGVKFMGATGHYVTAELDAGPIIAQDIIPISHRDSKQDMKRKGRDIEKVVLAKAVWAHLNSKVITFNNRTIVFE